MLLNSTDMLVCTEGDYSVQLNLILHDFWDQKLITKDRVKSGTSSFWPLDTPMPICVSFHGAG